MIKELFKTELLKGSNAMNIEQCCEYAAKTKNCLEGAPKNELLVVWISIPRAVHNNIGTLCTFRPYFLDSSSSRARFGGLKTQNCENQTSKNA